MSNKVRYENGRLYDEDGNEITLEEARERAKKANRSAS